jgi:hypothetical protein
MIGAAASVAAAALAASALAPLVTASLAIDPAWRAAGLPKQKPPPTLYRAEVAGGRPALRIEADASYGNLVHAVDSAPAAGTLSWAWRVDRPNPATNLAAKAGDDVAARVCISFALPIERVPFVERQLLRLARMQSGLDLPAATLCWVWAGAEDRGALIDNAYTRRVRQIVLRNRSDAPATWFEERRDIAADFARAFGGEAPEPPPVTAVIVAGDADNTRAATLAYVADLSWER